MAQSGFANSRRKKQAAAVDVNDPGLLASIGAGALSGLQYLGETLNKPSRALWGSVNYLTGGDAGGGLLNLIPFSDTLGWTDPRQGVELSGVVDRMGILPENQAGFDRWDIARFGLDLIGDPTTYLGPGIAGKVGRVAKKAGVVDDALRAGRLGAKTGPRFTAMNTTLRQALDKAGDAGRHREAWEAAEAAAGGRAGLDAILDKPLASALTFGVPFTGANVGIGTGRIGRGLAKAMDFPGQVVGASAVGRFGRQLFDPSVKGEFDPAAQALAESAFHNEKAMARKAQTAVVESQNILKEGYDEFGNFMGQVDAGRNAKLKRPVGPFDAAARKSIGPDAQIFSTSKGSQYLYGSGKSIRNKAKRAGHGADSGIKPISESTLFTSPDDAQRVGMWNTSSASGKRIIVQGDEVLLTSINPATGKRGIDERFTVSRTPEVGKHPLELFDASSQGKDWWKGNHPGSEITGIRSADDTFTQSLKVGDKVLVDDLPAEIEKVSRNSYSVFYRDVQSGATRSMRVGKDQLDRIKPIAGAATPAGVKESVAAAREAGRSRAWTAYERMVRAVSEEMPSNVAWDTVVKQLKLPRGTPLPDHVLRAVEDAAGKLKVQRNTLYETAKSLGAKASDMDTYLGGAEHFPRTVQPKIQKEMDELMGFSPITRTSGGVNAPSYKARTDETRNAFTLAINELLNDKKVRDAATGKDRIMEYVQEGKLSLDPEWGVGKNADEVFNPAQIAELDRIAAEKTAGTLAPDAAERMTADVHKTAHAEALAQWSRDHFQKDLFTKDVAAEQMGYLRSVHRAVASKMAIHETVVGSVRDAAELANETGGGRLLKDVFRRAGMDPNTSLVETARRLGVSVDEASRMAVPDEVAAAIVGVQKLVRDMPKWKQTFLNGYDKMLRLFKESVTTQPLMPGYFARNWLSGLFQNFASGEIQTAGDIKRFTDATASAWRGGDELADEIKGVFGQDELFGELADVRGDAVIGTLGLEGTSMPRGLGAAEAWQEAGERVALEPSGIPGLDPVRKAYGANTQVGQNINAHVEWMNRVPMYVYLRRKGFVPDAAKQIVDKVQFDYRHGLSQFEKDWMRRLMPFYSFSKLQAKFLAEDLLNNPGGLTASLLKANAGRGAPSPDTPDWIASTAAVDMGEDPEGNKTFLTGFGLPFEDTARLIGNPLSDTLSRLTPAIKAPLELATGRSFFQSGRDLRDQDPTIGRLLGNIGVQTGLRDSPNPVKTPALLEQVVSNSPASKYLNTLKSITDTRKSAGNKATAFFTGIRTNTVSPSLRAATIQQRVDEVARDFGGRPYTRYSFQPEPGKELTADQVKLKGIYSALAAAAKKRKAEREASQKKLNLEFGIP